MSDILLGMKIKFLRDITVDVFDNDNTFDKLMRKDVSLDCVEINAISKDFSNVVLESGILLVDVRNDSFERLV